MGELMPIELSQLFKINKEFKLISVGMEFWQTKYKTRDMAHAYIFPTIPTSVAVL